MATYIIGQRKRFTASVFDDTETPAALADPTALTVRIQRPTAAELSYTWPTDAALVRDAEGEFHVDYTFAESGQHYFRWKATGAVVDAAELGLMVQASRFTSP